MTASTTTKKLFGFLEHVAAIIVGFVLMMVGIGMGVTMIMIPLAIPIGLFGAAVFFWGLFEHRQTRQTEKRKP